MFGDSLMSLQIAFERKKSKIWDPNQGGFGAFGRQGPSTIPVKTHALRQLDFLWIWGPVWVSCSWLSFDAVFKTWIVDLELATPPNDRTWFARFSRVRRLRSASTVSIPCSIIVLILPQCAKALPSEQQHGALASFRHPETSPVHIWLFAKCPCLFKTPSWRPSFLLYVVVFVFLLRKWSIGGPLKKPVGANMGPKIDQVVQICYQNLSHALASLRSSHEMLPQRPPAAPQGYILMIWGPS